MANIRTGTNSIMQKMVSGPDWGMWVHTFNELVSPEVYYQDHPEYYSQVDGKRIPTQLCLTNPEVLEITVQNLRRKIAQNPTATYWSVSQNDNKNFCTCSNCKAIDDREGSPSGSIINFVNQVADQFPDKMISTLAYEYGTKSAKDLKAQGKCQHHAVQYRSLSRQTYRPRSDERRFCEGR